MKPDVNNEITDSGITEFEENTDLNSSQEMYDTENGQTDALSYNKEVAEAVQKKAEMEEQDRKLLEALDNVLEKHTQKTETKSTHIPKRPITRLERSAITVVNKGVGFVSLGLVLIFMSVIMLICLFSPEPDFMLPLKLSPIAAVLIGVEILFNQISTRGCFKINIPSLAISAVYVIGCCIMCVALDNSGKNQQREYNDRAIAAEIYDRGYRELRYLADIESMSVDVDLNTDGNEKIKGIESLNADDIVNINVKFAGTYNSPELFASDCKKIIDGYKLMDIDVTNYYFSNESTFHSYKLNVEGRYTQDFSESRLAEMVNYIYIENIDYLDDISDFVEETNE